MPLPAALAARLAKRGILPKQKKGKYNEDLSSSRILYTDSIQRVVEVDPTTETTDETTNETPIHTGKTCLTKTNEGKIK